jgi:hypothetical protein
MIVPSKILGFQGTVVLVHPSVGAKAPKLITGKGKVHLRNTTKIQMGSMNTTLLFRWDVGGQHHSPVVLPSGKTRYPFHRRLGGTQDRSGRVRKISHPSGFDPRTVQSVAIRYTD